MNNTKLSILAVLMTLMTSACATTMYRVEWKPAQGQSYQDAKEDLKDCQLRSLNVPNGRFQSAQADYAEKCMMALGHELEVTEIVKE